jgi:hypothetical protein
LTSRESSTEELLDFVNNRMQSAHVYQPLVLEFLAESGGRASVRQLAVATAAADEAAIDWYAKKIDEMPVPVLSNHGVVTRDGPLVRLPTEPLSY